MGAPSEEFTIVPGRDESGRSIFSVLVKRTYAIRPGQPLVRADRPRPLDRVDIYHEPGDPESATVRYEADLAPYKPATDVVVLGKVFAPGGRPVAQLDATVDVAGRQKTIRVIGDRRCLYRKDRPPSFSDPVPFTEMEVRYERAYGGADLKSQPELPFYYPRNPLGTGVALKNTREAVDGLALPNLEDSQDLLTPERVVLGEPDRWSRQPLPQGFGWFQKTWYPRCSFAGSVPGFVGPDEVLREEVLGLVPKGQVALARQFKLPGFDARFNNGASPGLTLPHLKGDEPIRLVHLTPEGDVRFALPGDVPGMSLDIGLGQGELEPVLHTLCIRLDAMQVDLVWRGARAYPGVDWLTEMKRLHAEVW